MNSTCFELGKKYKFFFNNHDEYVIDGEVIEVSNDEIYIIDQNDREKRILFKNSLLMARLIKQETK